MGAGVGAGGGLNIDYFRTIPGILQIIKFVLSVIILICVGAGYPTLPEGGGWTVFVGSVALIVIALTVIMHVTKLSDRIGAKFSMIELISMAVLTLFYIIAFIVEAVIASITYQYHPSAGGGLYTTSAEIAAAVFCALVIIAFIVHIVIHVTGWRLSFSSRSTTTTTVATTTTSATTTATDKS